MGSGCPNVDGTLNFGESWNGTQMGTHGLFAVTSAVFATYWSFFLTL